MPLHMTALLLALATITGTVHDARTGRPVAGIVVAAGAYEDDFSAPMAGEAPPALPPGSVAVTARDGSYTLRIDDSIHWIALDVYGAPDGYVTYHGVFSKGLSVAPDIGLVAPTAAERRALDEINAFRRAPGGAALYGNAPLVFDQNLVLAARYWANEERIAHRIGHTCAQLGNPVNCVEFNAYFHALPGAPQDDDAGQNTAFDPNPSWTDANRLFESEGALCHYNWYACGGGPDGSARQTGHYVNLMSARRWIGLGEAAAGGEGSYFALNVL